MREAMLRIHAASVALCEDCKRRMIKNKGKHRFQGLRKKRVQGRRSGKNRVGTGALACPAGHSPAVLPNLVSCREHILPSRRRTERHALSVLKTSKGVLQLIFELPTLSVQRCIGLG